MAQSLAVKYRPSDFSEVLGQTSTIKILEKQLEKKIYTNCYLFAGPSGEGKTTLARIFASHINGKKNSYIEIDAASNSSVDSIRTLIAAAYERSVDTEYKIYIIDEAHAISSAGWQAFLKCIEEPPKYTIFIFCTTNPEKIPPTIQNRVMRFNLSRISTELIKDRLEYISSQEGFTNYKESCDYIAKLADGGCRDAIAMLEKCAGFNTDLSIDNVLSCLGNLSYKKLFDLTNAIIDGNEPVVTSIIEELYNAGHDLRLFVEKYLDFVLDLNKYSLLKDMRCVKIPLSLEKDMQYATGIENASKYFGKLVDAVLKIKIQIRYDTNIRTTIEAMFLSICRGL